MRHTIMHQNLKLIAINALFWTELVRSFGFVQRTSGSGKFILRASKTDFTNVKKDIVSEQFGGRIQRICQEEKDETIGTPQSFLAKVNVPTFAVLDNSHSTKPISNTQTYREGLEGVIPGAFVLRQAIDAKDCEEMIECCESLGFGNFNAGKNNHGALQIVVSQEVCDRLFQILARHMHPNHFDHIRVTESDIAMMKNKGHVAFGLNRRWRIYRYSPGTQEAFAPHIDAGFPGSGVSPDKNDLIWDNYPENEGVVSRLTVLMYLNQDFSGGQTNFYKPLAFSADNINPSVVASIQPTTGAILVFPQCVGEDAMEFARQHWPLHEGSPVDHLPNNQPTRSKYVIRSDILFRRVSQDVNPDPLFRYDHLVRQAFLPRSSVINPVFLSHALPLYNPVMGVENIGTFLYAFVRFTKVRRIVEIGAGYTSLWILQALKDNDAEMNQIRDLVRNQRCKLLDWPWTPEAKVESFDHVEASLLCIDNCLHQKETASGAAVVAKQLGLDGYFEFIQGDAYELNFEENSIDMLWCDFGVGSRIKDFVSGAWNSLVPGGFLICHSSLTNQRTRDWVEAVRRREGTDLTGLPEGEYVELSLLEPYKHYQNSMTIIQKRKDYNEPIYSEYA